MKLNDYDDDNLKLVITITLLLVLEILIPNR